MLIGGQLNHGKQTFCPVWIVFFVNLALRISLHGDARVTIIVGEDLHFAVGYGEIGYDVIPEQEVSAGIGTAT